MNIITQYKGLDSDVYILAFGRMVTNLGAMVWPMMTLILNQKMGFSASDTAFFIIVMGCFILPANLIGGSLADRFSKKWFIVICDLISVILYMTSAFISLSMVSLVIFTIAAMFQTLELPAYQAIIAEVTPTEYREKAYSLSYLGANIGLILSPVIAGFLFNRYLWLCFLINAISIGISAILIASKVSGAEESSREIGDNTEDCLKKTADNVSVIHIIKKKWELGLFLIVIGLYEGAYSQFGYLMPLSISASHGAKGAAIYGTVMSINCIAVVLLTPVITKLFEKEFLYKKYSIGAVLQLLSFIIFMTVLGYVWGYYAAILVFTVGEIFTTIVRGPIIAEAVSDDYRGRIYGIASFISSFMAGICEYNSGCIFDYKGAASAWEFSIAMAFCAAAGAIFITIVKNRHHNKSRYSATLDQI